MEITPQNQMITTCYIDQAHAFTNKKTAEKYCSLLPKAMKNLKYKPIFISNPDPENTDLRLELLSAEFYLQHLKDFREFIQTIHSQRDVLVNALKKAELEVEDIEHAAEFYNLDASHGYQLYSIRCCTMPECVAASAKMRSRGSTIFWGRLRIDS